MKRFSGRTFLVTGVGSGIGRATAIRLADEGGRLVAIDRDHSRLSETVLKLGEGGHSVRLIDTTDEPALIQMARELHEDHITLDGIVHCAGIHWLRPLQLTDQKSLLEMLNSHVASSIALTRAVVSGRLVPEGGTSVIWLSSAAALQGGAGALAYSAAKGALISAARVLAVELARRKVRVNVIAPGVVRTAQSDAFLSKLSPEQVRSIEADHLLGLGEPEDIAGPIAFLLSSDARWITGTTIVVDGGLTAH
jgi:NAD(P)-dependent dehydrogenase (short-subunit alcohol dehydrogenase family)